MPRYLNESEHLKAVSANINVGTKAPRFELKWTNSDKSRHAKDEGQITAKREIL